MHRRAPVALVHIAYVQTVLPEILYITFLPQILFITVLSEILYVTVVPKITVPEIIYTVLPEVLYIPFYLKFYIFHTRVYGNVFSELLP